MIWYLTNAETEILSLRTMVEDLPEGFPPVRAGNPDVLEGIPDVADADAVLLRVLGGRRAYPAFIDGLRAACHDAGVPFLAFGGEATPDAELTALSTVPAATLTQALAYLVAGGPSNMEQLLRFVADTVARYGFGFDPPLEVPATSQWGDYPYDPDRPTVGIVFYRAHLIAGNTQFVDDLARGVLAKGANPVCVAAYSLRPDADGRVPALELLADWGVDVVVTTVQAMGSTKGDEWDASALGALGVPVLQAVATSISQATWTDSDQGLPPIDVGNQVAIPEFDGRIISVPFTFKELVDDGELLGYAVTANRTNPGRVARVAGLAVNLATLRRMPPPGKKAAIVLSAYPTKRSRLGNAVALDTPASVVRLLGDLRDQGWRVEGELPGDGTELMHRLADGLGYDRPLLERSDLSGVIGTMSAADYCAWFATLPAELREDVEGTWGPAPGEVHRHPDTGDLVFTGLDLGGVLVGVQPPRGFGKDTVGEYHSPDMPPGHHYLAFYRWVQDTWGADVMVHAGKHGTLEWLPGKSLGLSAGCAPDAALSDLPFVYPFLVNDPGEGAQAKRRAHAVIIDHLLPPMTRAEVYDDLAHLERLLDTMANVASLDPAKLPAIRGEVWDLLVRTNLTTDLGLDAGDGPGAQPDLESDEFDDMVGQVDGYLCELKDAQVRGGLHILGRVPEGEQLVDLVLAITRLPNGATPSLRDTVAATLGVDLLAEPADRVGTDRVEAECRRLVAALAEHDWNLASASDSGGARQTPRQAALLARTSMEFGTDGTNGTDGTDGTDLGDWAGDPTLAWICAELVPNLRRTTDELTNTIAALDGRFVPAGPSGSPTRGMAHVLPTGRNFYSVDPRGLPSPLAWDVGCGLADRLIERHVAEEGRPPRTVGLVLWGTAAMRTAGDDVAEVLALLGVRPTWLRESGRVNGLEIIPLAELGRPRVDVVVRISGFFRDAFPHLVALMDDAVAMVAALDEPPEMNPLVERSGNGAPESSGPADPRIFGPKPGGYGSGILPTIETRDWHSDEDLAEVYLAWGGWAYSRDASTVDVEPGTASRPADPYGGIRSVEAPEAMRRRFARIEVAVKNQDTREHDIFDSDDYLQDHGGMVVTIRALTGNQPKAWIGDSSNPSRPRVRSLAEEAARVVRTRVVNPKWIGAMMRHGYKGAFELAATVDYLFGYDATARVVADWMYERVTEAYVADPAVRAFLEEANPWALRAMAERLLEAHERGMWDASDTSLATLRQAVLEGEGWEERRG